MVQTGISAANGANAINGAAVVPSSSDANGTAKSLVQTTNSIHQYMLPLTAVLLYTGFLYHVYYGYSLPLEWQEGTTALFPSIMSVLYLIMIFGGRYYMSSRSAYSLRSGMLVYNIYQSLLNLVMAVWFNYEVHINKENEMSFWGNYPDWSVKGYNITFLVWMHYNNKYVEFLDTFFMVFRKKHDQVSFLHVYHHVLLVWSWYAVVKISPGGDVYFGAMINSFVHTLMYAYYALALSGVPCPWKKYLTIIQMIQFCFCATQSFCAFYWQNVPFNLAALQLFVMVNMLYLFSRFYMQKYAKTPKQSKKAE